MLLQGDEKVKDAEKRDTSQESEQGTRSAADAGNVASEGTPMINGAS